MQPLGERKLLKSMKFVRVNYAHKDIGDWVEALPSTSSQFLHYSIHIKLIIALQCRGVRNEPCTLVIG